jgi:hypothetical protein
MKKSFHYFQRQFFAYCFSCNGKKNTKKRFSFIYQKENTFLNPPPASGEGSKSVIKLNLTQLAFRNFSLQYEYGFHKNMSGALGISLVIPRNIPGQIYSPPSKTEGWQIPKFSGFAITPEFRFYPGKKEEHQAPHGFYIAPYFRYAKYKLTADYLELYDNNTKTRTYLGTVTYGGVTGGLMIGSQWIINDHFSIDWWILGGGGGAAKFYANVVSDGTLNLTTQEQADLKDDIRENIGDLGQFGKGVADIQTTPNSATLTIKGVPMQSIECLDLIWDTRFS